jgi:MoaA/NifB/PqqE/SkfB family radical SAM enzyme
MSIQAQIIPWLSRFTDRLLFGPMDWVQVEVTSRCNAACGYCPRTRFRESWQERTLPAELFDSLLPALGRARLVYLQGWGEPFLHPGLLSMARKAKAAGCMVGTTTNGMLLGERLLEEIVDSGLDILTFSLAGTRPETNDTLRRGTSMDKVLAVMERLQRIKSERKSDLPEVHMAYMLVRSGIDELHRLPGILRDCGAMHAVVSVLDFDPGDALRDEVLTTEDLRRDDLVRLFSDVREEGARHGIAIHTPAPEKERIEGSCSENIHKALFVSADGSVSPCVLTNVPAAGTEHEAREGTVFGNIQQSDLATIWRVREYAAFRAAHMRGSPPPVCRDCPKKNR